MYETLQAITVFGLFANDIKDGIDQFSAFGVVSLGPIVAGAGLSKDEVIRAEDLAVGAGSNAIHGPWLQIHQHSPRNVPSSRSLIVVHVYPLQLDIGGHISGELSGGIDPVLVADHFPEFGTDLVPALATLHVQYFPHSSYSTFSLFLSLNSTADSTHRGVYIYKGSQRVRVRG